MRKYKPFIPKEFTGRRITNEQAMKVLKKYGLSISDEEASSILSFLYLLAQTTSSGNTVNVEDKTTLGEIEPERQ